MEWSVHLEQAQDQAILELLSPRLPNLQKNTVNFHFPLIFTSFEHPLQISFIVYYHYHRCTSSSHTCALYCVLGSVVLHLFILLSTIVCVDPLICQLYSTSTACPGAAVHCLTLSVSWTSSTCHELPDCWSYQPTQPTIGYWTTCFLTITTQSLTISADITLYCTILFGLANAKA